MRARGFTLIELVVTMAVGLLAVAAGMMLLIGSNRWFQSGVDERAMQETARVALDELTRQLRTAGYGMEPTFAFDVGPIATTVMDLAPIGTQVRFGGYQCGGAACRDRIDGPDELVFYARDPLFERDVTATGANSLTLATPAALKTGQVLQVMCYGTNNQWLWAYVTVNVVNAAGTGVTLAPTAGLANDFPTQNALLGQPCFGGGTVRAFKIDRFRYHVAAVDQAGNVQNWETPGTRPFLLLDQGLSQDGRPLETAIAPDIEDLQVGYVFALAPAAEQVLGATPGTQVVATTDGDNGGFNLAPANGIPSFSTASLDPLRTTHHPANVRAIKVAITVRRARQDLAIIDAIVPAALNRPDVDGEPGFRRMVFESSTYVHNLEIRKPVFPTYDPNAGLATCCPDGGSCSGNCGGG